MRGSIGYLFHLGIHQCLEERFLTRSGKEAVFQARNAIARKCLLCMHQPRAAWSFYIYGRAAGPKPLKSATLCRFLVLSFNDKGTAEKDRGLIDAVVLVASGSQHAGTERRPIRSRKPTSKCQRRRPRAGSLARPGATCRPIAGRRLVECDRERRLGYHWARRLARASP